MGTTDEIMRELQEASSLHVLAGYNGKIVNMQYVTPGIDNPTRKQINRQFRMGSMRIYDNLGTGGHTDAVGYVKLPNGSLYAIGRESKTARRVV